MNTCHVCRFLDDVVATALDFPPLMLLPLGILGVSFLLAVSIAESVNKRLSGK